MFCHLNITLSISRTLSKYLLFCYRNFKTDDYTGLKLGHHKKGYGKIHLSMLNWINVYSELLYKFRLLKYKDPYFAEGPRYLVFPDPKNSPFTKSIEGSKTPFILRLGAPVHPFRGKVV